jgi:CelD/BcsL family acetyltransferase involved in cellulose biosynthesis
MMEIELINDAGSLEAICEEWNALLLQAETKATELSYEWQLTYWKYVNDRAELFVLVARENGRIIGIAPLRLSTVRIFGLKTRMLEFIAQDKNNYQDFIIPDRHEEVLGRMMAFLLENQHRWEMLSLNHIPETSSTVDFIRNRLNGSPLMTRVANVDQCLYLNVDGTWEEYVAESRKARKTIAARLRKLQKAGEVVIRHISDEADLQPALEAMFEQHRRRWNTTRTPSIFNESRYRHFYSEVAPQLLNTGRADFLVLELDGKPVAIDFGFILDRAYQGQMLTYDPDYMFASPAKILIEQTVKEAFTDGAVRFIDFGYSYPYKKDWTKDEKNRFTLEVYSRKPLRCWVIFTGRTIIEFFRAFSHKSPLLRKIITSIRGW